MRYKLFQRKKCQPNNEDNRRLYNLFRNRVIRELKESKIKYYTKFFEDNNNIKKTWEGIRSIIDISKSKLMPASQIKELGNKNQEEITDAFNDFFCKYSAKH